MQTARERATTFFRSACRAALAGALIAVALPVAALTCADPAIANTPAVLRPGTLLLLGELHGTTQSPRIAARLVCDALTAKRRVVLFLEIPSDEQARLDAYLASDGSPAAQAALIAPSAFWSADAQGQDGRRSVCATSSTRPPR